MQKGIFFSLLILLIGLAGCGGQKQPRSSKRSRNKVNMAVASAEKPKVSFFDTDIGGFEDIETFVLDDETAENLKAATNADATLAWDEPTTKTNAQKQILYFEYDSSNLRDDQQDKITATKAQINKWVKDGYKVVFKGHACKWGKNGRLRNLPLSHERAYETAQLIMGKDNPHMRVFGVGNEEPVSYDNSKDGQAPNRRVEIYPIAA